VILGFLHLRFALLAEHHLRKRCQLHVLGCVVVGHLVSLGLRLRCQVLGPKASQY